MIDDNELDKDVAEIETLTAWFRDVEAIFKAAAVCESKRKKYKRGAERNRLLKKLRQDRSTFYKLAKLNRMERFKDPDVRAKLPKSFTGVDETGRLSDELFTQGVDDGTINPNATAIDIKTFRLAHAGKASAPELKVCLQNYDPDKNGSVLTALEKFCTKHDLPPPTKRQIPGAKRRKKAEKLQEKAAEPGTGIQAESAHADGP